MSKTLKSETELLRLLHETINQMNICSGVLVTRVIAGDAGDWRFEIPSAVSAPCRSAIIRAQATLRLRYDLAAVD